LKPGYARSRFESRKKKGDLMSELYDNTWRSFRRETYCVRMVQWRHACQTFEIEDAHTSILRTRSESHKSINPSLREDDGRRGTFIARNNAVRTEPWTPMGGRRPQR
jgi:hypothetical protein